MTLNNRIHLVQNKPKLRKSDRNRNI